MQNLDNKTREEYKRIRFPSAESVKTAAVHRKALEDFAEAFLAAFEASLHEAAGPGRKLVLKSETVRDLSIEFTHDEIMNSSIGKHAMGEELVTAERDGWINHLLARRKVA